jgi:hypothetical protein
MQTTEPERLLVIEKKEEVCRLSLEILDILHQDKTDGEDVVEVKKKMIQVLSLLHVAASYGSPNRDLDAVMRLVLRFFSVQSRERDGFIQGVAIGELFCITVNSIEFTTGWIPPILKAQVPPHDILTKK